MDIQNLKNRIKEILEGKVDNENFINLKLVYINCNNSVKII